MRLIKKNDDGAFPNYVIDCVCASLTRHDEVDMAGMQTQEDATQQRLKEDAEAEMARKLRDETYEEGRQLGRYKYDAVKEMTRGARGWLVTCQIRRERSSIHEIGRFFSAGNSDEKISFGIVKLGLRGVVMLLNEDLDDKSILETVSNLYDAEDNVAAKFTHRVSPVFSTFLLDEKTVMMQLERVGKDLALFAKSLGEQYFTGTGQHREPRQAGEVAFAISYTGRSSGLSSNDKSSDRRLEFIGSLAKGFSEGYGKEGGSSRATVSLTSPDLVITMDLVNAMSRDFLAIGLCPSSWCTVKPKLKLKSLLVNNQKNTSHSKCDEQHKKKRKRKF